MIHSPIGHKKFLRRAGWSSIIPLLLVLGLAISYPAGSGAASLPPLPANAAGRLITAGKATWKVGRGPWVGQADGAFPISLPLELKTEATLCRVEFAGRLVFEAAARSQLTLAATTDGQLLLGVSQGAVLYSVPASCSLKVTTSAAGLTLQVGAGQPARQPDGNGRQPVNLGVLQYENDKSLEIVNLAGCLTIVDPAGSARELPASQCYRTPGGASGVIEPLSFHARPETEEGRHVIEEATVGPWQVLRTAGSLVVQAKEARLPASFIEFKHDMRNIRPERD